MAAYKANVQKNAIYNTIKSAFTIIYPLVTFPYISRVLGAGSVGKVDFGSSIISYFSMMASLGVYAYAIRECSKVREDKEELTRTASQIYSINLTSTMISYLVMVVVLLFARSLDHYRLLICIQSLSIILTTLGAEWVNSAMEDFRYVTLTTVGFQILSLILMLVLVKGPENYLVYAGISVLAYSGYNVPNLFYRRRYCKVRYTLNMDLGRHLPSIFLMFSMILAQTILTNSDITILGLIKGDYEVGLYSTSVKLYNIVRTVVASVAYVVMPQLSNNFARGNYDEINRLLRYALNFVLVLGLPCVVGMNVITREIIYVMAGEEYLGATTSLRILSIALLFSFVGGWISNMTLLPDGKEKICLFSCAISAAVNIVLNFILIPAFGLNAAAFTTALAELIGILYTMRHMDSHIHIDRLGALLRGPLVGCVGILVVGTIVRGIIDSYYLATFITIGLGAGVYVLALLATKDEFFLGIIRPLVGRFRKEA